jgi:hypothetical protein
MNRFYLLKLLIFIQTFLLTSICSTTFSIAHARDPDLHIQWQLRWNESEILPGKPQSEFVGDSYTTSETLKMNWVKKNGAYNIYNGKGSLEGKRRVLILKFLTENQTYFSPSQIFTFKFPYENCSDWSDWEKPRYVDNLEGGIDWALLNKRELTYTSAENSPVFEIRYRIGSWSKTCDYRIKSKN